MSEKTTKTVEEIADVIVNDKATCINCGNNQFAVEKIVTTISGARMTAIISRKCTKCNNGTV